MTTTVAELLANPDFRIIYVPGVWPGPYAREIDNMLREYAERKQNGTLVTADPVDAITVSADVVEVAEGVEVCPAP